MKPNAAAIRFPAPAFSRLLASLVVPLAALFLASWHAPLLAAESIVIGRSLALSGALKAYGEAKRDGGDAYIDKVNKAGGVGGKQISLVTLDDEYAPPKTVANLKKLASENAPTAFLGLFGVPTVAAALPVLLELKIPAVGLTSGTAAVRTPHNPYAFPVRASYADEARKLVSHVKTMGLTKVAVMYTDNPFGEAVKSTLLEVLRAEKIEPTLFKLDPAGANATALVKEVDATKPQSVFLCMLSQAAIASLIEFKKTPAYELIYTFSTVDTTGVVKALGGAAAGLMITQIVPIPAGSRSRVVVEYVQALKDLGRGSPSFYGLEGFIEAKVLVEGLRRAAPATSPASLGKALESMREFDAGDFVVSYQPGNHAGSKFVEIDVVDSAGTVRR